MTEFVGKEQVMQQTAFRSLSRFCRIDGKKVFEVGGNSDCVAATPFADHGASKIVVTGLDHVDTDQKPSNPLITLERADALRLSEQYDEGSFDLVYGISILEHIPTPHKFFSEVLHILSKGGMAFLQGAPVWSAPWGHHIWLTPWYDGTTGCYQFIPDATLLSKGVNVINPIPDWGHLLYTPDQLADVLLKSNIPKRDIGPILNYVYKGNDINRESARSIVDAIYASGLKVIELEYDRVKLPQDKLEILRGKYGNEEDFSILGIRVILRKD